MYRHHIGSKGRLVVVAIVEGLAPLGAIAFNHAGKPFVAQIVEVVVTFFFGEYLVWVLWVPSGKGTVSLTFLGIVVTDEVHATAMDTIAVSHDTLHDTLLSFGLVEGLLDIVHIIGDLDIDIR